MALGTGKYCEGFSSHFPLLTLYAHGKVCCERGDAIGIEFVVGGFFGWEMDLHSEILYP